MKKQILTMFTGLFIGRYYHRRSFRLCCGNPR